MAVEDAMTIDERRRYLKRMVPCYQAADRAGRSALLSEMELVTGLHRKSLTRLLQAPRLERRPRRRQRGSTYGPAVAGVVRVVWESLDYVCAERLTPALLPTAQHLAQFGEVQLTPDLAALLERVSVSTVQRLLRRLPRQTPRLPQRGPEQANAVRHAVPMKRLEWSLDQPGYCEVDLVHHCGASTAGDYVHTLQLVDIATGWSERVAVLGRSARAMEAAFQRVLDRIPFAIKELHPDNGAEFFNHHLVRFFGETVTGMQMSRSRPYHKNDTRFVEQKNYTLVRAYVGYGRLDTPAQAEALDQLYEQLWVYYNLFQPVLHLTEKVVVAGKLQRTWDTAATPYQRLLATQGLTAAERARLAALYELTNPRQLRRAINDRLVWLGEPPCAPAETLPASAAD